MTVAIPRRSARESSVTPGSVAYVGLLTRAIAFALDALLIDAIAIVVAAVVALTLSVVSVPEEVRKLIVAAGGVGFLLLTVGYFVTFWCTTGQTPGSRALRIVVRPASGDRIRPRRALLRFVGLTLAAIPMFAGFLMILVDDRRRGLHDWLARTVVVEANDGAPVAAPPHGTDVVRFG